MGLRIRDVGLIPDLETYKPFDLGQASHPMCVTLGSFACKTEMLTVSWCEASGGLGYTKWAPKPHSSNSRKPNLSNPGITGLSYVCIIESTDVILFNNKLYVTFNMCLYFLHRPPPPQAGGYVPRSTAQRT